MARRIGKPATTPPSTRKRERGRRQTTMLSTAAAKKAQRQLDAGDFQIAAGKATAPARSGLRKKADRDADADRMLLNARVRLRYHSDEEYAAAEKRRCKLRYHKKVAQEMFAAAKPAVVKQSTRKLGFPRAKNTQDLVNRVLNAIEEEKLTAKDVRKALSS